MDITWVSKASGSRTLLLSQMQVSAPIPAFQVQIWEPLLHVYRRFSYGEKQVGADATSWWWRCIRLYLLQLRKQRVQLRWWGWRISFWTKYLLANGWRVYVLCDSCDLGSGCNSEEAWTFFYNVETLKSAAVFSVDHSVGVDGDAVIALI